MAKKLSGYTKFLSGVMAFAIGFMTPSLVKGVGLNPDLEMSVKVIEMVASDDETVYADYFAERSFSDCTAYRINHEHAYVNEKGETVKWIVSEALEVDGLLWTEEKRETDMDSYECNVEEPHAHLYFDEATGVFRPFYEEEDVVNETQYKTPIIRFLDPEKCEVLHELGLCRKIDNMAYVEYINDLALNGETNGDYHIVLLPIEMNEYYVIFKHVFVKVGDLNIEEFSNVLGYVHDYLSTSDMKKYYEKNAECVIVYRVDSYQQQILYPPLKK